MFLSSSSWTYTYTQSQIKTTGCLQSEYTELLVQNSSSHKYKIILDQNSLSDLEVNQTKTELRQFLFKMRKALHDFNLV